MVLLIIPWSTAFTKCLYESFIHSPNSKKPAISVLVFWTCLASFIAKHKREIPKNRHTARNMPCFSVFLGARGIFKPFKLMVSPQQASRVLPSSAPEVGIAPGAEREPHCRATTFRDLSESEWSPIRGSPGRRIKSVNKMRVVCFELIWWFDALLNQVQCCDSGIAFGKPNGMALYPF